MLNDIDKKTISRIDTLINKGNNVLALYRPSGSGSSPYDNNVLGRGIRGLTQKQPSRISDGPTLNRSFFTEWQSQVLSFLISLLGTEHTYAKNFKELVTCGCRDCVEQGQGVLRALKEDISQGYLTKFKSLVAAELIGDFIDQAVALVAEDYHIPAASLAGAVLEDTLRKMCESKGIPVPDKTKIDKLNADLAKAGVYNKLIQKRITALADIRNNADHGHFDKFTKEDVEDMVAWVRKFTADPLE